MKKTLFLLTVASLLAFVGCEKETTPSVEPPSVDGFSVSEGHQVRFASGNLEFDSIDGYRFAANQYDRGGYFGWGTGSNPTLTSTNYEDYPTFDDWGSHIDGGWRTLSADEWYYVIWDRTDASSKRGAATVCGVHGMILLPDNWNGGTFTAGFNGWETNVYEASSWSAMEAAGAVFLPAAGCRYEDSGYGSSVYYVGKGGYYWSSTPYNGSEAFTMDFFDDSLSGHDGIGNRYTGRAVRLVQDY